jgi:hypothetical protein
MAANNLLMLNKRHDDDDVGRNPILNGEPLTNPELTPSPQCSPTCSKTVVDKTLPCRRYIYYFNSLPLCSSGSLQVYDKSLVVTLPERTATQDDRLSFDAQYLPYINVFVNKQQHFSFDWLPIYTKADLSKCKDMLYKLFHEYLFSTQYALNYPCSISGPCDLFEMNYQNQEFSLFSQEQCNSTSIQIDIHKNMSPVVNKEIPTIHVQLYIGSYLIFCSHRDLWGLSDNNVNYITHFILSKISKF